MTAALHQIPRSLLVAGNAESPHIVEVAFTSAFNYCHYMVGMPQGSVWIQYKGRSLFSAFGTGQATESAAQLFGIQAAFCADAPVALKHLLPEVSRVRSELVLVDAVHRAERATAFWHLEPAPAA